MFPADTRDVGVSPSLFVEANQAYNDEARRKLGGPTGKSIPLFSKNEKRFAVFFCFFVDRKTSV